MSGGPRLIAEATGRVIVTALEVADGFWSRLIGLQFRRGLPPGRGFLLVPCSSIHTCWMRFAIDVVFLDAQGRVLAIKSNVRPWRIALAPRGTYAILEMAAGQASYLSTGAVLTLATEPGASIPRTLQFLRASPIA